MCGSEIKRRIWNSSYLLVLHTWAKSEVLLLMGKLRATQLGGRGDIKGLVWTW